MSYIDWRATFVLVAEGDDKHFARLWNLEHEHRIDAILARFRERLAGLFAESLNAGEGREKGAVGALTGAVNGTFPIGSAWLGHLTCGSADRVPEVVVTFVPARKIAYELPGVFVNPDRPQREVKLPALLKARRAGSGMWDITPRFIWITFGEGGRAVSAEDPTAVKRELGLDHFRELDFVYRAELRLLRGGALFVPSCLDAGLGPAWMAPIAAGAPWGVTRDLTDGQPRWPELLVQTSEFLVDVTAVLVSPPGTWVRIGPVGIDYRAAR